MSEVICIDNVNNYTLIFSDNKLTLTPKDNIKIETENIVTSEPEILTDNKLIKLTIRGICDKCKSPHKNRKVNICSKCRKGKCDICEKNIDIKYNTCFEHIPIKQKEKMFEFIEKKRIMTTYNLSDEKYQDFKSNKLIIHGENTLDDDDDNLFEDEEGHMWINGMCLGK